MYYYEGSLTKMERKSTYHVNCESPFSIPEGRKAFKAHYRGTCHKCSQAIQIGQYITWNRVKSPSEIPAPIETPIKAPSPETQPFEVEDEAFKMEVPEKHEFDEVEPKSTPKLNGSGDGLLDLISSQVEAKVIGTVRDKVSNAIELLDKQFQDKLAKLAIPSLEIKRPDMPVIKIHNVHKQFNDVLQLLNAGEYVYLHGSPGGHKSSIGPQLAEALGVRYGYMSLCEQTPEYVVKGFTSPIDGKYYQSMFVDFYENGGLFCWEELDAANDNLRTALNTMLENKLAALDKGLVPMHNKFYLLANGNTCGKGAHPAFPSRTAFDSAFAARFFFLQFEYDWSLCRHITESLNKDAKPVALWAEKVANWSLANDIPLVMSPREVYKVAKLLITTTLSNTVLLDGILKGLDLPSKEKVLTNFPFPNITRS